MSKKKQLTSRASGSRKRLPLRSAVIRSYETMEVRLNSKKQILKSFMGWLPLALFAAIFYGMIFMFLIMLLLENFAGIDRDFARQIAWPIGAVLLLISIYLYLKWLTRSLSSYELSMSGDELVIRGKSGWSNLDRKIPIGDIEKIYIGNVPNSIEKLSLGHGAINDQVTSRLTIFPRHDKPFKLDFAAKAFNNESLFEFLVSIKNKGVETNVNV